MESNLNSLAYVAVEKSSSPFLPPLFAAERVDGRLEALAEAVFEIDLGRGVAAGAFEAAARRGRVDAETGGACAALRAGMIRCLWKTDQLQLPNVFCSTSSATRGEAAVGGLHGRGGEISKL